MRMTVLSLGVAVSMAGPAAAMAQTAAFVGNHYESTAAIDCPNSGACVLTFPVIPGTKIVRVTQVQCKIDTSALPLDLYFAPSAVPATGFSKRTRFATVSHFTINSLHYFVFESTQEMHIAAGRYPNVAYIPSASAFVSMKCALAGVAVP